MVPFRVIGLRLGGHVVESVLGCLEGTWRIRGEEGARPHAIVPERTRKETRMALEPRSPRLAVLIDADNTSAKIADRLFEEIAQLGEASVRRIYGDFTRAGLRGWTDILAKHAIIAHQQFAYVTGKNASDIALVIDAMDLMHSGRFEGFCLVSSDSDFTRLAARLREEGLDVFGFGERKTPESFRQACRRFIYTENLLAEAPVQTDAAPQAKQSPSAAVPILQNVISQMEGEDGWIGLGPLGHRLAHRAQDFDPRSYGVAKLGDLVRKSGAFEIDQSEGRRWRVRLKPDSAAAPKPSRRRRRPAASAKADA